MPDRPQREMHGCACGGPCVGPFVPRERSDDDDSGGISGHGALYPMFQWMLQGLASLASLNRTKLRSTSYACADDCRAIHLGASLAASLPLTNGGGNESGNK